MNHTAEKLLTFIKESPTAFQAVEMMKTRFTENGFTELKEDEHWEIKNGGKYFVIRNHSAIIAFTVPEVSSDVFHIIASHSDSPSLKIKENPEMVSAGHYVELNAEKYGGMLCAPWFDRPLSIAGRVMVRADGGVKQRLINFDRDLVMIPNLAIHMDRNLNDGYKYNAQKDMIPIWGDEASEGSFDEMVAAECGASKEDVVSTDLFLYNRMPGTVWGAQNEYISSPHLDDVQCAYASVKAMLKGHHRESISVCCVFDNEEVGSGTKQGAGSTFFPEVLKRISYLCGKNEEEYYMAVADSFMLSADNAHAVHPNYQDKTDPTNRPYINEGIVLKYNASQKYTTDANSAALVKYLCKKEKIKCQVFFNRSDMLGGSTLGNILTGQVSIKAADIGLPQLSMHSTYETAGCKDLDDMITLMGSFYELGKEVQI